ncbi:MAG: ABC transporter permease, partial [Bosea sp. (in: a-proteobacteria)]
RTTLLIVSIAVAFLIYGLTASFRDGAQTAAGASAEILGVTSANGRTHPLPLAALSRITAMRDVAAASYASRLRGFVGVEKNVVAVSATDPALLLAVNGKELGLTPDLVGALGQGRDRALVGRALAEAQGWAVGQHATITAFDMPRQDGSRDWRFEIAGVFEGESAVTDTYFMIARYDYVNAARARAKDSVDNFIVRPRPGVPAAELAVRIDGLFTNSATPTRTQSEKQFLEAFLRQYADIGLIVNLVVAAAFVTLLMITVNTMVFAVRERRFEIAVLKTLGFPPLWILALILSETLLVFILGGGLGLLLAKLATLFAGPALGLVFSLTILARALGLIAALGLGVGALPSLSAMRTPIVTALRAR